MATFAELNIGDRIEIPQGLSSEPSLLVQEVFKKNDDGSVDLRVINGCEETDAQGNVVLSDVFCHVESAYVVTLVKI